MEKGQGVRGNAACTLKEEKGRTNKQMLKNMKAQEMQVAESIINRPAGVGGLSVASDGEAQQSPGHSLLLVPLGSFRLLMMEVEWKVAVRSNFDF